MFDESIHIDVTELLYFNEAEIKLQKDLPVQCTEVN